MSMLDLALISSDFPTVDFYFHLKKLSLPIFTSNFITRQLGIFPPEIGKKRAFFTLGLGPIFGSKNAVGKSLLYGHFFFVPKIPGTSTVYWVA
jgi:hypothetical protein